MGRPPAQLSRVAGLLGLPVTYGRIAAVLDNVIDGFDYDIGASLLRSATAADELELLTVLREWHLDPTHFHYARDIADPR